MGDNVMSGIQFHFNSSADQTLFWELMGQPDPGRPPEPQELADFVAAQGNSADERAHQLVHGDQGILTFLGDSYQAPTADIQIQSTEPIGTPGLGSILTAPLPQAPSVQAALATEMAPVTLPAHLSTQEQYASWFHEYAGPQAYYDQGKKFVFIKVNEDIGILFTQMANGKMGASLIDRQAPAFDDRRAKASTRAGHGVETHTTPPEFIQALFRFEFPPSQTLTDRYDVENSASISVASFSWGIVRVLFDEIADHPVASALFRNKLVPATLDFRRRLVTLSDGHQTALFDFSLPVSKTDERPVNVFTPDGLEQYLASPDSPGILVVNGHSFLVFERPDSLFLLASVRNQLWIFSATEQENTPFFRWYKKKAKTRKPGTRVTINLKGFKITDHNGIPHLQYIMDNQTHYLSPFFDIQLGSEHRPVLVHDTEYTLFEDDFAISILNHATQIINNYAIPGFDILKVPTVSAVAPKAPTKPTPAIYTPEWFEGLPENDPSVFWLKSGDQANPGFRKIVCLRRSTQEDRPMFILEALNGRLILMGIGLSLSKLRHLYSLFEDKPMERKEFDHGPLNNQINQHLASEPSTEGYIWLDQMRQGGVGSGKKNPRFIILGDSIVAHVSKKPMGTDGRVEESGQHRLSLYIFRYKPVAVAEMVPPVTLALISEWFVDYWGPGVFYSGAKKFVHLKIGQQRFIYTLDQRGELAMAIMPSNAFQLGSLPTKKARWEFSRLQKSLDESDRSLSLFDPLDQHYLAGGPVQSANTQLISVGGLGAVETMPLEFISGRDQAWHPIDSNTSAYYDWQSGWRLICNESEIISAHPIDAPEEWPHSDRPPNIATLSGFREYVSDMTNSGVIELGPSRTRALLFQHPASFSRDKFGALLLVHNDSLHVATLYPGSLSAIREAEITEVEICDDPDESEPVLILKLVSQRETYTLPLFPLNPEARFQLTPEQLDRFNASEPTTEQRSKISIFIQDYSVHLDMGLEFCELTIPGLNIDNLARKQRAKQLPAPVPEADTAELERRQLELQAVEEKLRSAELKASNEARLKTQIDAISALSRRYFDKPLRIPLQNISSKLPASGPIRVAVMPVEIRMRITLAAQQRGIGDLKSFIRKRPEGGPTVTLMFGRQGQEQPFSVSGQGGDLELAPVGKGSQASLGLVKDADGYFLEIPTASEIHAWWRRDVLGPRLSLSQLPSEQGYEFELAVTGELVEKRPSLMEILGELGLNDRIFVLDTLDGGAWRWKISFGWDQFETMMALLQKVFKIYSDNLEKIKSERSYGQPLARLLNLTDLSPAVVPTQTAADEAPSSGIQPEPAIEPPVAPPSGMGTPDIGGTTEVGPRRDWREEVVLQNIPLKLAPVKDNPALVQIKLVKVIDGAGVIQEVRLEAIRVRNSDFPCSAISIKHNDETLSALPCAIASFPFTLAIERDSSEPEGVESLEIWIKDAHETGFEVMLEDFQSRDLHEKDHKITPRVTDSSRHIVADVFTLKLRTLSDPVTDRVTLNRAQLELDDSLRTKHGMTAPFVLRDKQLPRVLGERPQTLVFDHEELGEVVLSLRLTATHQIITERKPIDFIQSIALRPLLNPGDPNQSDSRYALDMLIGQTGQTSQSFLIDRIPIQTGSARTDIERRYLASGGSADQLLEWMQIVGQPVDFQPGFHTDVEITELVRAVNGHGLIRTEVQSLRGLRRNADGSIPLRVLHLTDDAGDTLNAALGRFEAEGRMEAAPSHLPILVPARAGILAPLANWGIHDGDLLPLTDASLDWICASFAQAPVVGQPFHLGEGPPPRLEFEADNGLVISIPVTWAPHRDNPFKLDTRGLIVRDDQDNIVMDEVTGLPLISAGRRIYTYIKGRELQTRQIVGYEFKAHDEGGHWSLYLMVPMGNGVIKEFNLRVLKTGSLFLALYADGDGVRVQDLRQRAEQRVMRYLSGRRNTNPPLYVPHRTIRSTAGHEIELTFVSPAPVVPNAGSSEAPAPNPANTSQLKAELTGFRWVRGENKLRLEDRVALVLTQNDGMTETLTLEHAHSGRMDVVTLTETVPPGQIPPGRPTSEPSRRFAWDISQGTITPILEESVTDLDMDRLRSFEQEKNIPTRERRSQDRKPRNRPETPFHYHFVPVQVPTIPDPDLGFVVPPPERVEQLADPERIKTLLKQTPLHNGSFLPVEETAFAQTLIGRESEWMSFMMANGVILQLELQQNPTNGKYQAHQDADSKYVIKGKLLLPDPSRPGWFFELGSTFFHEKRAQGVTTVEMEILLSETEIRCFDLKLIESGLHEVFGGRKAFAYQVTEDGKTVTTTRHDVLAKLRSWLTRLNLDRDPDVLNLDFLKNQEDDSTIKTRLKGNILNLAIRQRPEDQLFELEGIEEQGGVGNAPLRALVRRIDEQFNEKPPYELFRAGNDSALYYLRDTETGAYYNFVISQTGMLFIWTRNRHIREFLRPPRSSGFPMVNLHTGENYASGGTNVATRDWVDAKADQPGASGHFAVTALLNRERQSQATDVGCTSTPHVKFELWLEETEPGRTPIIKVRPGRLSEEEKTRIAAGEIYSPFGEDFEIDVHEEIWTDRMGQSHRGRVTVVFRKKGTTAPQGQPSLTYGWIEFKDREAMLGEFEHFSITKAAYHEADRLKNFSQLPTDTGYLTKRAGIIRPDEEQLDSQFSIDQFTTLELGLDILAGLRETTASAPDFPLLMSAMEYLGLINSDGSHDEQTLTKLAAWAALLKDNQGRSLKRAEVLAPRKRSPRVSISPSMGTTTTAPAGVTTTGEQLRTGTRTHPGQGAARTIPLSTHNITPNQLVHRETNAPKAFLKTKVSGLPFKAPKNNLSGFKMPGPAFQFRTFGPGGIK